MEVVNADHAGVIICEVLWNQELVIESVIQLIFLGLCVYFISIPVKIKSCVILWKILNPHPLTLFHQIT